MPFRHVLLAALTVTGTALPAKTVALPQVLSPTLAEVQSLLGVFDASRGINVRFDLGEPTTLRAFGFSLQLSHRLSTDSQGQTKSTWGVDGLVSWLVPQDRDHLVWRSPAGESVNFPRSEIGIAYPTRPENPWMIRRLALNDYEISSRKGLRYQYHDGMLVSVINPMGVRLSVKCCGTQITSICYAESPGSVPLLAASYRPDGKPVTVRIGAHICHFHYDPSGQLLAADLPAGRCSFAYTQGLVTAIMHPDDTTDHLAWQQTAPPFQHARELSFSAYLSSYNRVHYAVRVVQQGVLLTISKPGQARPAKLIVNPRRQTIVCRSPQLGQRTLQFLQPDGLRRGLVTKVTDNHGQTLEAFAYDAQDRVIKRAVLGSSIYLITYDSQSRVSSIRTQSP